MNIYSEGKREVYRIRNFTNEILWKFSCKNEVAVFKNNRQFKDSHCGDRCFIVANGPSVKKQDLSLLKNEFVFTVNRMVTKADFNEIKTNVHIWSDLDFFTDELFDKGDMVKVLLSVNTDDNKPICFFPIGAKTILERYELNKSLDINYFKQKLFFYENYKGKMDLCDLIINGSTVVLVAMVIAIYMGFREINLLGCDCTGAKGYIDSYGKNQISEYAFDIPREQGEIIASNTIFKRPSECSFRNFYNIFKDYRVMGEYCKKKNINIFNCTEGGILDTFPLKTLKEALDL